jgi:hypothetical protein
VDVGTAGSLPLLFDAMLPLAVIADEPLTSDKIIPALRRATLSLKAVPVLMGSAFRNKGIQFLLDAVVDYLPSPLDVDAAVGIDPESGEPTTRPPREDAPAAATPSTPETPSRRYSGSRWCMRCWRRSYWSGWTRFPRPTVRSWRRSDSPATP